MSNYSIEVDGVHIILPLPFSRNEQIALNAFLALPPDEQLAVIVKQNTDDFLANLLADYPDLKDRKLYGSGTLPGEPEKG
jgi:hypothetical protein